MGIGGHGRRLLRSQRGAVQLGGLLALAGVACGGVGVGFAGQRLMAEGPDPTTAGPGGGAVVELVAHGCPGGAAVASLHSGDQVFVTARSDDGDWVRIRNPLAPQEQWWVTVDGLDAHGPLDELPVVACDPDDQQSVDGETDPQPVTTVPPGDTTIPPSGSSPDTQLPPPEPGEVAVPTAPGVGLPATVVPPTGPPPSRPVPSAPPATASPTTRPPSTTRPPTTRPPTTQPPTTSPPETTTVPPDRSGPSLDAWLGGAELWEMDGGGISCGNNPRSTTVSAAVSDPSGIASVTATWRVGNHQGNVTLTGGATRTASVGPHPYHTLPSLQDRVVAVTVTAIDGAGNESSDSVTFTLHSTDWCFG